MAAGFENGFENGFGVPASEGFDGDNGNKNTEVTFFRRVATDDPKEILVLSDGPYNFGDALDRMPQTATAVQGSLDKRASQNASFDPDGP